MSRTAYSIHRASGGRTTPSDALRGASHPAARNRARSSDTSRSARASPDRARPRRRRTAVRRRRAGESPEDSASTACATRCCCCTRSYSRCRSCRPGCPLRIRARARRSASALPMMPRRVLVHRDAGLQILAERLLGMRTGEIAGARAAVVARTVAMRAAAVDGQTVQHRDVVAVLRQAAPACEAARPGARRFARRS